MQHQPQLMSLSSWTALTLCTCWTNKALYWTTHRNDMRKYVITDMRVVPSRGGHHMEILCYCSHSAIATWIRPDSLPLRARLAAGCTRWTAIHEYYQKHQLLTKPRIAPDGVGQMTRIRSPHSQRLITVLLLQSTPDETTAGERLRKVMTDAGTVIDISADSIRVRVRKS